jgi:hypothetical protein
MGLLRELRTRVQRDQLDLQRDLDGIVELASWGVDLAQPQWLRLFLFVANTPTADRLSLQFDREGWEVSVTCSPQDERLIVCAQRRTELSLANVSRHRRHFQTISTRVPGTEYDGWEAGA